MTEATAEARTGVTTDATDKPLIAIVGAYDNHEGVFICLRARTSEDRSKIVTPDTYRNESEEGQIRYLGTAMVPALRTIVADICTNDFYLGVKRIDVATAQFSIDVLTSHRHLLVDYLVRLLEQVSEHYGRKLKVFIDLSSWREHEVPLLKAGLAELDPTFESASDFKELEPLLFAYEH